MHADLPAAATVAHPCSAARAADGAQHARAPLAGRVVGEDVVDLVATPAAAAEPAHVRPLPVLVLQLDLGLDVLLLRLAAAAAVAISIVFGLFLVVVLDGEAEVHERAVPGVAKCHDGEGFVQVM